MLKVLQSSIVMTAIGAIQVSAAGTLVREKKKWEKWELLVSSNAWLLKESGLNVPLLSASTHLWKNLLVL